jgi:hypothetical protein
MMPSSPSISPLAGVTVWLSCAVPELESWDGRPLDSEVLEFVTWLTGLVLKEGGNILHGAHPSSTAVLIEQARRAQAARPGRDRVTLVVSKFWADETAADVREWKSYCRVIETEVGLDAQGQPSRELSLEIMRGRMADDAHAFVAVGGKWWSNEPARAGIPLEFELARRRGLPCFLIGGKSAGYLREHPEVLTTLSNGLSPDQNRQLAESADLAMAPGAIVAQLCALFDGAPEAASAEPAHALFVELATRIATQRLHYRSGDEETAATSISSLFKTTRELMTKHPKAREFHRVALALLNDTVRPYTARWHGWMTQDGDKVDKEGKPILKLRDEWVRRKFREELRELQPRLVEFQKAFAAISEGRRVDRRRLKGEHNGSGAAALGDDLPLQLRPQVRLCQAKKAGRDESLAIEDNLGNAERLAILQRRAQMLPDEGARRLAAAEAEATDPMVSNAIGLALSGGGIRSATFCLGVVQTLQRKKLFAQFDYLSTVSGGGYFGSFLSAFLGTDPAQLSTAEEAVEKDRKTALGDATTPRYERKIDAEAARKSLDELLDHSNAEKQRVESAPLRHLRNNSRYLLAGGTWGLLRIMQVFLGGFLASLLILVTVPVAAAWLLRALQEAGGVPLGWVEGALWIVAGLWLVVPFVQRCAHGAPRESKVSRLRSFVQNVAIFAVLAALLLSALHFAPTLILFYEHAGHDIAELATKLGTWQPPEWLAGFLAAAIPAVFGALVRRKDGSTRGWAQVLFHLTMPAFFLVAFCIVASQLGLGSREPTSYFWPAVVSIALGVWAWLFVNINAFAPHGYYRDRLCECYLVTRGQPQKSWRQRMRDLFLHGVRGAVEAGNNAFGARQRLPLTALGASTAAPYHLINATLNAEASKNPELRGRNGDFFVFSRHFCGSPLTGYITTEDLERSDPHVDLGTAMAISGAAASTNMGWQTVRRLRFLMTLFNVRLGYWLPRPGKKPWPRPVEAPGPFYFFRELLGLVHEKARFINLSDGGHIENLAVYELLRRQCKFIVAVDAGMEPKMECADLMRLQRYAAIDLGIRMHFDPTDLTLLPTTYSRAYAVLVKIDYAPEKAASAETSDQLGWMLYLKLAVTGTEPRYVLDYRRQNPAFPHQTTADQLYDEAQFEAYRALGEFAAASLFREEIVGTGERPQDVEAWFQALANSLLPDNDQSFFKRHKPDTAPNP